MDELKRKAIASMDDCYLEIGTNQKNVIQRQAIPPALREKIYDQIIPILCTEIKGMELSDEEIRKYYLGGRLTAVKDCLKAHLSKVVNTLEGREGE